MWGGDTSVDAGAWHLMSPGLGALTRADKVSSLVLEA